MSEKRMQSEPVAMSAIGPTEKSSLLISMSAICGSAD
jgi:hypothetical protein